MSYLKKKISNIEAFLKEAKADSGNLPHNLTLHYADGHTEKVVAKNSLDCNRIYNESYFGYLGYCSGDEESSDLSEIVVQIDDEDDEDICAFTCEPDLTEEEAKAFWDQLEKDAQEMATKKHYSKKG